MPNSFTICLLVACLSLVSSRANLDQSSVEEREFSVDSLSGPSRHLTEVHKNALDSVSKLSERARSLHNTVKDLSHTLRTLKESHEEKAIENLQKQIAKNANKASFGASKKFDESKMPAKIKVNKYQINKENKKFTKNPHQGPKYTNKW
eukprot:CAMPEP_0196598278 /NCGR_PEP_ID=MMETSP1081-20130531/94228_1 /TAXON_ID=36882 /ORGANISM="Pyramimonas amylifera, Strain CCMP720" /LENGTH=148 /DNA_ID=CAMNT_0041923951 /DNA_START=461 /DNA_END=904 /DNA_ORIENTATION=-